MKKYGLLLLLNYLGLLPCVLAQSKLGVLKANSTKITIKDGDEPKTRFWQHLQPNAPPVLVPLLKTLKTRQVGFYTDLDSIFLTIAPNQTQDLLVLLRGDTCRIRLSTFVPSYSNAIRNTASIPDTIPFVLTKEGNLSLKCRVNGAVMENCIFDSGASHVYVVGSDLDKKLNLKHDGFIEDESVTGLATETTSLVNKLTINSLEWENLPIIYINETGFTEGGVWVGYNVFENKTVEIDFDNSLLIIHQSTPLSKNDYSEVPMRHTSGGTYLQLTVGDKKTEKTGWFLFDTGATGLSLSIDGDFLSQNSFLKNFKKIGEAMVGSTEAGQLKKQVMVAPVLKIGNYESSKTRILIGNENYSQMQLNGTVGMDLMRRFNIIIDYPNSKMWIKANHFYENPIKKK